MPTITAENQEFHLSHEEEDKLNQFQSITNFPEADLPLIIRFLQNHSWNLEPALSRYFDDNWKESLSRLSADSVRTESNVMDIPTGRTPSPSPPPRIPALAPRLEPNMLQQLQSARNMVPSLPLVKKLPDNFRDRFKVVGLNHTDTISNSTNPLYIILLLLPKLLFKLVEFIFSIFTTGILNNSSNNRKKNKVCRVPKLPILEEDPINIDNISASKHDNGASAEKIKEILKGPRLSFNEALRQCEEQFKFLLIIMVGDVSSDVVDPDSKVKEIGKDMVDHNSKKLLTNILSDNGVLKVLDDYKDDVIIYLGSVLELEPWLVARDLNVKYTPECILVGNVLNSNGSMNGTTRLSTLSKLRINSSRMFQNSLKVSIERYYSELIVSRTDKEELRFAREIKELQEQAYQDSLRKDRIKEKDRKIEAEKKAIEEKLRLEREQHVKLNATLQNLKWLELCLDILNSDIDKATDTANKTATLQIRTSSGTRILKKFASEMTLHSVYCNVGCHLYLKNNSLDLDRWNKSIVLKIKELMENESVLCFKDTEIIEDELDLLGLKKIIEDEIQKWEADDYNDFVLSFDFELVSPFPRYKLPSDKHTHVREVSQIWPNGSLLVEDIVESDSDDENSSEGEE